MHNLPANCQADFLYHSIQSVQNIQQIFSTNNKNAVRKKYFISVQTFFIHIFQNDQTSTVHWSKYMSFRTEIVRETAFSAH